MSSDIGLASYRPVKEAAECILVTGGAGFIGSNFVLEWIGHGGQLVNFDKLTYAGNLKNLVSIKDNSRHVFIRGDINNVTLVRDTLQKYQPGAIVHLAAESHVDRSILGPGEFITTNVQGTFHLLEEALRYWQQLSAAQRASFRFVHVSTDEVYGSLGPSDLPFTEASPYSPNSPYAASKAASDHFVRAYHNTYGLPAIITNCSNNYGPWQFPEKLIPLMVVNAIAGKPLPVYGDGKNIRDWLYVQDHCEALRTVVANGRPGETYNIGGGSEMSNLDLVQTLCRLLNQLLPNGKIGDYSSLITFVKDRPGHDRRYAIDSSKIRRELGWQPRESFEDGLRKSVCWYLENQAWVRDLQSGAYQEWIRLNYEERSSSCGA
jgi:dTDP-glucose 4,6-dehydratase